MVRQIEGGNRRLALYIIRPRPDSASMTALPMISHKGERPSLRVTGPSAATKNRPQSYHFHEGGSPFELAVKCGALARRVMVSQRQVLRNSQIAACGVLRSLDSMFTGRSKASRETKPMDSAGCSFTAIHVRFPLDSAVSPIAGA
jgi:hypothetical protein